MKRNDKQLYLDCIEFFEAIEKDGCFIKYRDERRFKASGKKYCYLFRPHKDYIYSLICQEEYSNKYPLAHQLIKQNYEEGHKLLYFEDRIAYLFELIENDKTSDNFSDGSNIYNFIKNNLSKIYKTVIQNEYRNKYPKSYLTFLKLYHRKVYDKLGEFLKVIEQEKKMITTLDTRCFSNGEKYCYFWHRHYCLIMELIKLDEYSNKYPYACMILRQTYKHMGVSRTDKCLNYIEMVEDRGSLFNSNDKIRLRCGTVAYNFGKYNYDKIYKLVSQDEYRKKYPIAYKLIRKQNIAYEERSNRKYISIEMRCEEFYKMVEERKTMFILSDNTKFSDGTYVKSLLMNNRQVIYDCLEEYKDKYPYAYSIIKKDYLRYIQRKERKLSKVK